MLETVDITDVMIVLFQAYVALWKIHDLLANGTCS